jgi:transaldolase/glucose-6-phosphate isomerase
MTMTKIQELLEHGQSIWFDYIRRLFIESGDLQKLLDQGVRGVTSNPSIFEKAIAGSADYDADISRLVAEDKSVAEIYEALTRHDIRQAADLFRPLYKESKGGDGYVSLEVSPTLANDTEGTIDEAKRLFATLGRPNVMIKIPATAAGIPAIEAVIAEGINVNVTLIFSLSQYEAVANAYLNGLEKLAASGGDVSNVASVASFFISRVDSAVDVALDQVGNSDLQGKIAVDNARLAYARFRALFSGERWEKLAQAGARVQRPLWASTGTKNPGYPDTLYLDNLIGPDTVNTVPPATLNAFLDHGQVAVTVSDDLEGAQVRLDQLASLGIDLEAITQKLQNDGVAAFAQSFGSLMASIEAKREKLLADWQPMSANLGDYQAAVDEALHDMRANDVMRRIWAHDHTVWKPEPMEITNRLGWLHTAEIMAENLPRITKLVEAVQADGYTHALLLGMGGSSLAPEVFRKTFGVGEGFLDLAVLDSTDPGAVLAYAEALDPAKILFIVSTKSGGTVETLSFFKYFYNRTIEAVGRERAGGHFIAITDPGSSLATIAAQFNFRATFLNDPNIGGRYSALSYFGLVPAALVGVDLATLLDRAMTTACNAEGCNCPVEGDNNGARLGAIMGELANVGRDKVTLITSPGIASFGDWVEQLIAESTGKEGRSILPIVGEPVGAPDAYSDDRLFVYLRLAEDGGLDGAVEGLSKAGHPVITLHLNDRYDLGGQFFLWEIATVVAGARIDINPFDQPNVESAKILARQMVAAYQETGSLPASTPALQRDGIAVYGDVEATSPEQALSQFLNLAQDGAYIALQAYVQPTPEADAALNTLRTKLRDQTKLATTVGYGPRFLHSTGQLHKGDGGKGLFIQLTAGSPRDVDIPDEAGEAGSSISFGVLKAAQALGDRQALLDNGRQVIRFHIEADVVNALQQLTGASA